MQSNFKRTSLLLPPQTQMSTVFSPVWGRTREMLALDRGCPWHRHRLCACGPNSAQTFLIETCVSPETDVGATDVVSVFAVAQRARCPVGEVRVQKPARMTLRQAHHGISVSIVRARSLNGQVVLDSRWFEFVFKISVGVWVGCWIYVFAHLLGPSGTNPNASTRIQNMDG
jgi:hypothetical protein